MIVLSTFEVTDRRLRPFVRLVGNGSHDCWPQCPCPDHRLRWEDLIADRKFLPPGEVSERYRGGISVGTLRNWRCGSDQPSSKLVRLFPTCSTNLMRAPRTRAAL